ncbi:hypothetical protein H6503_03365 [Candidatus Woesearchaeota archaeon]|nr:hypothetical protein [Candidatus Woesearchaeota archaeon]
MIKIIFAIMILSLALLVGCQENMIENGDSDIQLNGSDIGDSQFSDIPEYCSSWFDGCNNCMVNDGGIAACTKKYCAPETMQKPKCLEYKIPEDCVLWYDGCNNCVVEDGKMTACTERACFQMDQPKCLEYK